MWVFLNYTEKRGRIHGSQDIVRRGRLDIALNVIAMRLKLRYLKYQLN